MVPIVTLGSLLCTDVTPFSSFCFNTRVPAYSWRCNSAPAGGSSPRHPGSFTPQPRGFPLFSQKVGQIWRSSTPGSHAWLAAYRTQKTPTQPSTSIHCLSWEREVWGLRAAHHALVFFHLCQVCWRGRAEAMPSSSTLCCPGSSGRSGMGGTGMALQLQQELPGFGAFRFTALMQH